jgi:DNA-binding CsgD family transcriptional regulator
MQTNVRTNARFDTAEFEAALRAADFDRCHDLLEGSVTPDGIIAGARLASRERRFFDMIGSLSDFPEDSGRLRVARDVFLGAALGYTSDYVAGQRLINRAMDQLIPGDPLYDDAYFYTAAIAWMQHDHRAAEEAALVQLRSNDPNNRARAHIMLSWIALRRSDVLRQVDELQGNELAAFGSFKKAGKLAPSEHWGVLCYLDRALLARNTGEAAFSAEQLQEASEIAQRVSWSEVTGEEREALLILAELHAHENPAVAEQYLARFRALKSSVTPMFSYGSDPRVRGFESYSQGIAWLRLGDTEEGKAALTEAWSIFEDFSYGWRAALCAMGLYEATHDKRWLDRAARRIAPWPKSWIARRIADSKMSSIVPLERIPPAKREVLELLREGQRNADIAKKLGRSPHTVRNQLAQLFQTFDVKSRAELVAVLSKQVVPITSLTRHKRKDA